MTQAENTSRNVIGEMQAPFLHGVQDLLLEQ